MSNAKRWIFTLNNPSGTIDADIVTWYEDSSLADLVVYQHEVGESGTPHLQGLVVFKARTRLAGCKRFLDTAHWEPMRGQLQQAIDYCTKEDTRDPLYEPITLGHVESCQGRRSDLAEIKEKLDAGAKETEIADEHFGDWVRYHRSFREYKRMKVTPRDFKTEVTIVVGPTGTGKSTYANGVSAPDDTFFKQNSQWWDGYDGQETVVLDDFYGWIKYDEMLRLMDRYPLLVQTKGGQTQFLAKRMIITSNAMPLAWYSKIFSDSRMSLPAFIRRVDKWMYMGTDLSFVMSNYEAFCDRVNSVQ